MEKQLVSSIEAALIQAENEEVLIGGEMAKFADVPVCRIWWLRVKFKWSEEQKMTSIGRTNATKKTKNRFHIEEKFRPINCHYPIGALARTASD